MTPYAVVVGGSNMDLHAQVADTVLRGTSNPGEARLSPGGVGRNVAEVLARLGTPTHLISAVGDDPLGAELLAHTAAAGVDVEHVRVREVRTGTYSAVLSAAGELVVAVADMAAAEEISPLVVEAAAGLIRGASVLIVEGNLLPATAERAIAIAREAGVPVAVDPVSVPKVARMRALLGPGVDLVTPNRDELAALTDLPVATAAEVETAAQALRSAGVQAVWVRLGRDGSIYVDESGCLRLPSVATTVVDVTGAGDAMLAAYCHARLGGATRPDAARYGQAAAALAVASRDTVRADLCDELIRSLL